jgi:hypothetical protein
VLTERRLRGRAAHLATVAARLRGHREAREAALPHTHGVGDDELLSVNGLVQRQAVQLEVHPQQDAPTHAL